MRTLTRVRRVRGPVRRGRRVSGLRARGRGVETSRLWSMAVTGQAFVRSRREERKISSVTERQRTVMSMASVLPYP